MKLKNPSFKKSLNGHTDTWVDEQAETNMFSTFSKFGAYQKVNKSKPRAKFVQIGL